MSNAGRLKTRLVIEQPSDSDDGQGGVVRDYTALATVWAALTPLSAREAASAGAEGAAARVRVTLRNHWPLTLRHRLVDGDTIYRIVGFRDIDNRRFLEIDAERWLE